jgi:hypothetical protein
VFPEEETEIEEVYEHRYLDLREPTEMLVRVELIRDGLTGNCPRNRRVLVTPPLRASGPTTPTTQTASVGPPIGSVNGYDFAYSDGVRFTVLTPLTIDSLLRIRRRRYAGHQSRDSSKHATEPRTWR